MDKPDSNPLYIAFFFFLCCVVPLAVMLGISYLLRRLKLIAEPPPPPLGWDEEGQNHTQNSGEGGVAHG
jgi:hypothetical protein